MKRFIVVGTGIIVSLIVVGMVFAIPGRDDRGNRNDPTKNWRANACYDGGTLAGTCDTLEEWIAGWYLIRFEYGLISAEDFPRLYAWVLPTNTTNPSVPSSTHTATATVIYMASNTPTDTPTSTATFTPTDTATSTASFTPTDTPTSTPTFTPTDTPTSTPTFTPTNTLTP